MTYGSHLRRSRHGTLYFRYVVPADVRPHLGHDEVSLSLHTCSKREAELAALELAFAAKSIVAVTRAAIRMSEPVRPNLAALNALINKRRFKVLQDELGEADTLLAAATAQVDRLTSKLIARPDVPNVVAIVSPPLSAAIAAFKAERQATSNWNVKTAAAWESRLSMLLGWFGDVPVSEITRSGMTEFFNALKKLPKNAKKYRALAGLGMRELIEVEGHTPIASITVNQIMESMSALFAWMDNDRAKWKVSGNLAKGLMLSNIEGVKRVAFTADDLRAMFTSPEWTARKFLHSYGYWLLPLGLFTGARINELCQLELKDFRLEHGHPVMSLCTEGLRGKNKNARRTVPVHPELIRLGLLRHVERLRHAGETRLFPECVEKRDGHGQDASRWFGKFKVRAGIVDARKVFHSARHGFVSQLLNSGADEATGVAPLVGHARGGESSRTYWNDRDVHRLIELVNIVAHPVVTELVPVVEDVQFGIDVHRGTRRPPVRKRAVRRHV